MAFSVNDIISQVNGAGGLLNRSHFSMMITTPPVVQDSSTAQLLQYLIQDGALPGVAMEATPIKPHGIGLFESRPHGTAFTPLQINVIVDAKASAITFFQKWYSAIHNFDPSNTSNTNGLGMADFQYPSQYETTVEIYAYDSTGKKAITYKLAQAFPLNVGDIVTSWESGSEIIKLPVTMFYKYWSTTQGNTTPQSAGSTIDDNGASWT